MQTNNGISSLETQEFNPRDQLSKSQSPADLERRVHSAIRRRDEKEFLFLIAMFLQKQESIDFVDPRSLKFVSPDALQVSSLVA